MEEENNDGVFDINGDGGVRQALSILTSNRHM